jgi:hypothetical protein
MTKALAMLSVAALLLPACQSFASFTYFSTVQGWRTALRSGDARLAGAALGLAL